MNRRSFLYAVGSSCLLPSVSSLAQGVLPTSLDAPRLKLRSFDYTGVQLLPSRFLTQVQYARELYFNMSNDDMLKGFRREAGLPAPGNDMRGWCRENCSATFGQWISGMARLSRALNDSAMRDKAIYLTTEWEKTLGPGGDARMSTYAWEKMSCGLVDLPSMATTRTLSKSSTASPCGLPRASTALVPRQPSRTVTAAAPTARSSGTRFPKTACGPTPSPATRPFWTSRTSGSTPAIGTSSPPQTARRA